MQSMKVKQLPICDIPVHHQIVSYLSKSGFTTLTDIQSKTLLPALSGQDVMACSQTGSGKTLAFLIPSLHRLLTHKALSRQDPRALILAPTRELAKQVFVETKKATSGSRLSCAFIVGGENYNDQAKVLRRSPDIIIGTAGRIADHLNSKHFFLNGLELLILDEADRMLDLGFADALMAINYCANHRKRQTLMFSATLDSPSITMLASKLVNNPAKVNIGLSTEQHENIAQTFYYADSVEQKNKLLSLVLNENEFNQAIVFTATRDDTKRLADELNEINNPRCSALPLSANLNQQQRSNAMSTFQAGQFSVLVTTDVASRGLDMPKVGLVINFDLPKQADEYIHRIGRTGRAGQLGAAYSFVSRRDWASFVSIKSHLDYNIECRSHPSELSSFRGIKQSSLKSKNRVSNKTRKSSQLKAKKPSRINTQAGVDVGDIPIKRIKR